MRHSGSLRMDGNGIIGFNNLIPAELSANPSYFICTGMTWYAEGDWGWFHFTFFKRHCGIKLVSQSMYVCVSYLHFFLYVSETILFRKNAVQADCNAACTDVFLSHWSFNSESFWCFCSNSTSSCCRRCWQKAQFWMNIQGFSLWWMNHERESWMIVRAWNYALIRHYLLKE